MSNLKWLFAWADSNGVEIPIDSSGAANIPKLLELYNRANGGTGVQQTESPDDKKNTPATETADKKSNNANKETDRQSIHNEKGRVAKETLTKTEWRMFYIEKDKYFENANKSYISEQESGLVMVLNERNILVTFYGAAADPKIKRINIFESEEAMYDFAEIWSK